MGFEPMTLLIKSQMLYQLSYALPRGQARGEVGVASSMRGVNSE